MADERPQDGGPTQPAAAPAAVKPAAPSGSPAATPAKPASPSPPQPRARVFQVQQAPQTKKPVVQVKPAANVSVASGRIAVPQAQGAGQPASTRVANVTVQPPRPPGAASPGQVGAAKEQPQLEEFVQRLLRPLINQWLDGHMPTYIAEALRREQEARRHKAPR